MSALAVIALVCTAAETDLAALIDRADRIVVYESSSPGARVLLAERRRPAFTELKAATRLEAPQLDEHGGVRGAGSCGCPGDVTIRLFQGDRELSSLTNQHSTHLHASGWRDDAALASPKLWVEWFARRGIKGPKEDLEADGAFARQREVARQRWNAATPAALRSAAVLAPAEMRARLEKELPDRRLRILALFEWFGSGAGPWSGYPSYEDQAEELLFDYPTEELVSVIDSGPLSVAQTEGAARFLAGWSFHQKRPGALARVRPELKTRLLEHCRKTTDADKAARAKAAFAR